MINKLIKSKRGFTLIELIVVIAIIGILAAVTVPAVFGNITKAKKANAISEASDFNTAAVIANLTVKANGGTWTNGTSTIDGYTYKASPAASKEYGALTFDTNGKLTAATFRSSNGYTVTLSSGVWTAA